MSFRQSPVGGTWNSRGGQFPFARQHQHPKRVRRLHALRLHPQRDPIAAVRLHADFLHHPAVAVRIGGKILEAQRSLASMLDLRIHKTDLARLVMKLKSLEPVAAEILEPAVDHLRRLARVQSPLAALDQEWRILNRHALGQVGIVRQKTAAIADRKTGRDQFHVLSLADLLNSSRRRK